MRKKVEVIMNGFWSDFLVDNIPQDDDIYFAFAGKILLDSRCKILRLLYVGPRILDDVDILLCEDKSKLGWSISPDEQIIYATGNISPSLVDDGIDVSYVANVIGHEFIEGFQLNGEERKKDFILTISFGGKVPRIFQSKCCISVGSKNVEENDGERESHV